MMQNHLRPELLWQNINQVKRDLTALPNKHILHWMSLYKKEDTKLRMAKQRLLAVSHRSESVKQLAYSLNVPADGGLSSC